MFSQSHIIFGPDNNLYISSASKDNVLRFNGTSGAFINEFVTAGSGGLDSARGLAFGPDGNLYVVSTFGNEILRYNGTTGAFIDMFVGSDLNFPVDLLFSPSSIIPEPSSITLLITGASGLIGYGWRRKRKMAA